MIDMILQQKPISLFGLLDDSSPRQNAILIPLLARKALLSSDNKKKKAVDMADDEVDFSSQLQDETFESDDELDFSSLHQR